MLGLAASNAAAGVGAAAAAAAPPAWLWGLGRCCRPDAQEERAWSRTVVTCCLRVGPAPCRLGVAASPRVGPCPTPGANSAPLTSGSPACSATPCAAGCASPRCGTRPLQYRPGGLGSGGAAPAPAAACPLAPPQIARGLGSGALHAAGPAWWQEGARGAWAGCASEYRCTAWRAEQSMLSTQASGLPASAMQTSTSTAGLLCPALLTPATRPTLPLLCRCGGGGRVQAQPTAAPWPAGGQAQAAPHPQGASALRHPRPHGRTTAQGA